MRWIDEALREWANDYRGGMPQLGTVCLLGELTRVKGRPSEPSPLSVRMEGYLCEMKQTARPAYNAVACQYLVKGMNKGDKAKLLRMRKADYLARIKYAEDWLEERFSTAIDEETDNN